ncbi:AAA+ ATPase domain-containing protein [Paraburkholderia kururiensis]|uniref:AAA family ATPase n=1 Tax=Paraburkholderia kururiensis TaxID=984307 RepID=UPI0039A53AE3
MKKNLAEHEMDELLFKVVPPRSKTVVSTTTCLVLEQDNWNDYSFQTLYHLSYLASEGTDRLEPMLIGSVKILRAGQTKADGIQIAADFSALGEDFCSVGTSLDYYERLRELGDVGRRVMAALRDVVAEPELVGQFESEPGWSTSLFRDQKDGGSQFRFLATGLVKGDYARAPVDQQRFTFRMVGWQSPLVVDTTSGESDYFDASKLPERVNVLVGRNGSGKSTLLARLARVAFGSPSDRLTEPLSGLGALEPDGIGFPRIVTVAFSPFDSFKLPGSDDRNRLQIAKDMSRGVGRFSFIGLRDLVAEIEADRQGPVSLQGGEPPSEQDRVGWTSLKSIGKLTEEFVTFRRKIVEGGRERILGVALNKLERGLLQREWLTRASDGTDEEARLLFHRCSTGHKITLLVIFGLIASLETNSLVLVDEPETHLHPPLLSALMHALRGILEKYESSAVVATHSPVVVQESMARHVHVVRREGDLTVIAPVSTETFGESIGLITAQVFGMQSNATDFHEVLDALIEKYGDLEKIEALFKDGVMSHQARAYVLTRLATEL